MLRVAILGSALVLPHLFASAFAQLDFRGQNIVSENGQIPLSHHGIYGLVCNGISRNAISPALQVFSPGAVSAWFSELLPITYVGPPNAPQFAEDIAHWLNSSSQISACSVRPGTAEDLGFIVSDSDTPSLILMH
jgi:hypothetical protein